MTPNVNRFANLYSLFQYAVSQKLKYPKIRLQHGNDTVVVKLAGDRSRYEGQLMVTNDAGYGSPNNKYFGRIDQNGAIIAGRDLTPAVEALLEEFAANPVEVAQRYGKLTGNCMFCSKKLDDAISVAVGYGPVCAKKWNLPHSAVKQSRRSRKEITTEEAQPVEFATFVRPVWAAFEAEIADIQLSAPGYETEQRYQQYLWNVNKVHRVFHFAQNAVEPVTNRT